MPKGHEELKRRGGYVTADVIDVSPETLNLEVMLAKFNREHGHDEDEVRFIIRGGYSTLTPYISRYFDTTTGSKTDSHSYQEIAKILQRLPSEMVFISDCHRQSLMGCSRHTDTAVRVSRESSAACGRTPADPHSG